MRTNKDKFIYSKNLQTFFQQLSIINVDIKYQKFTKSNTKSIYSVYLFLNSLPHLIKNKVIIKYVLKVKTQIFARVYKV